MTPTCVPYMLLGGASLDVVRLLGVTPFKELPPDHGLSGTAAHGSLSTLLKSHF